MKFKQRISCFLLITIILAMFSGFNVSALKIGDEIGNVLNTDIKVYINDYRIPSYAINNKMCVVMEDLSKYGFNVIWDGKTKQLSAKRSYGKKFAPIIDIADNTEKSGTIAFPYLYTNITAYIDGKQIECFAIGGKTVVYIDDFADYGKFVWNSTDRTLKLTLTEKTTPPPMPATTMPTESTPTTTTSEPTQAPTEPPQSPSTPTSTAAMYKAYPTVPDFGAFSGMQMTDSKTLNDNANTIIYFYKGYDSAKINKYGKLLESEGFKYVYKDENGVVYYEKDNITVGMGEDDDGCNTIVCQNFNVTASTDIIKMYKEYSTVPDFGSYFGLYAWVYENDKDGSVLYFYRGYDSAKIDKYRGLLKNAGFVYAMTSEDGAVFYEKNGVVVVIGKDESGNNTVVLCFKSN